MMEEADVYRGMVQHCYDTLHRLDLLDLDLGRVFSEERL
jgi:hypothetical protein